ncbi:hypothetical protein CEXT_626751 [Caerostris extrusa]|uniref:Uncharacterized protein n=1 Tax=Caerostris extrusa TaxID=172846 RepID=A0AAV4NTG3_CAEEX|nr:hypothetical protein CEXT_626751 [Caerostris extrusa]
MHWLENGKKPFSFLRLLTVAQKFFLQKAIRDFQQTEPFSPKTTLLESIRARKTELTNEYRSFWKRKHQSIYDTHKLLVPEISFPSGQINTEQPHILKTS